MDNPQPVRNDRCQPASEPLTLDFVLNEVVRILDEERAHNKNDARRQLAA